MLPETIFISVRVSPDLPSGQLEDKKDPMVTPYPSPSIGFSVTHPDYRGVSGLSSVSSGRRPFCFFPIGS